MFKWGSEPLEVWRCGILDAVAFPSWRPRLHFIAILRHKSIVPGAGSSTECTWLMGGTVLNASNMPWNIEMHSLAGFTNLRPGSRLHA